eukprot:TRINITY_DN20751_c0_g1_i1.p1 TRINITY_DN20751_c0_g1~~TRINITY_DN20751_c0_g1_i1.p1  ORF type:complete len:223 (-),score=37.42 TRINITY_DN20751_c0_g1_i1:103-771(-)
MGMQASTVCLLIGLAVCYSQDIVCKQGRLSQKIHVGEGDSYQFKTQAYGNYAPNTDCHVTYKKADTCPKMRFSCSVFSINNKRENCMGRDKMQIKTPKIENTYCQEKGPDVTTSDEYLTVSFMSDDREQNSGATCRMECPKQSRAIDKNGSAMNKLETCWYTCLRQWMACAVIQTVQQQKYSCNSTGCSAPCDEADCLKKVIQDAGSFGLEKQLSHIFLILR